MSKRHRLRIRCKAHKELRRLRKHLEACSYSCDQWRDEAIKRRRELEDLRLSYAKLQYECRHAVPTYGPGTNA